MTGIYRLEQARQASYGIDIGSDYMFQTLKESYGEYDLSTEYAVRAEYVDSIADDATTEVRWNRLAKLEGITMTYAEQKAIRSADYAADNP